MMAVYIMAMAALSGVAAKQAEPSVACSAYSPEPADKDTSSIATIDQAWSGAAVRFDAVVHNNKVYLAYYDPGRWLTVAQVDPATSQVCKARLANRFAGWDAHNSIQLAFDSDGILHVAGNMHATPLVYARAAKPDSLEGLSLRTMVGKQEDHASYPMLMRIQGRMAFMYRDGRSGNGDWLINGFRGGAWHRIGDLPLLASSWRGKPISAYPTAPVVGDDGAVHFAIVWRLTADVETNIALNYVTTRDFQTFRGISGDTSGGSITPATGDTIDAPGANAGLLNGARLSLDASGRPIIVYHRYGPEGINQIFVAHPTGKTWEKTVIATAKHRTTYVGRGSLPDLPAYSGASPYQGKLFLRIKFTGEPWQYIVLDATTFEPVTAAKGPPGGLSPAHVSPPPGLRSPIQMAISGNCDAHPNDPAPAVLSYVVQAPNGDQRPDCAKSPEACSPAPTALVLKMLQGTTMCRSR